VIRVYNPKGRNVRIGGRTLPPGATRKVQATEKEAKEKGLRVYIGAVTGDGEGEALPEFDQTEKEAPGVEAPENEKGDLNDAEDT